MVTGAVPVEVNVMGCVEAVFTVTLPNVRLAVLMVNCGLAADVPVPLRSHPPLCCWSMSRSAVSIALWPIP